MFASKEFRDHCESIKLLRSSVSSSTVKRLKQVLGADTKIFVKEYADALKVQIIWQIEKATGITEILTTLLSREKGGIEKVFS